LTFAQKANGFFNEFFKRIDIDPGYLISRRLKFFMWQYF